MHLSRNATRGMILASGATVLAAGAALAQGPPGGGGPNMAAMQQWRDQHKFTFKLRAMLTNGIMELERDKATALKPAQATKTLAVLVPLTKKPKLNQDEARASIKKLQAVFDSRQLTSVETAVTASQRRMGGGRRPGGGPGGGGPGGGGPPGGFGGPPGGRPGGGPPGGGPGGGPGGRGGPGGGFNAAAMKDFNPFNPKKDSFGYERNVDRNQKLITFLKARAAGKEAKLEMPSGFGGRGGPGRGGPGGGPGGFGGPGRGGPGAPPPPPR